MARRAADLGADALLVHPPTAFRDRPDRDALILDYHSAAAEAGLPLVAFYLYESAGGITYSPELLAELLGRDEVLGVKIATLDSVMTFQDIARLIEAVAPSKVVITGEDRFLGYSLMCGARAALIGMAAACTGFRPTAAGVLGRRSGAFPEALRGRRRPGPAHVHRPDGGLHPPHALVSGASRASSRRRGARSLGTRSRGRRIRPPGSLLAAAGGSRMIRNRGKGTSAACDIMGRTRPHLLPAEPDVPADSSGGSDADHDRFAGDGLPEDLESYLRATYGLDMTASYAGSQDPQSLGQGLRAALAQRVPDRRGGRSGARIRRAQDRDRPRCRRLAIDVGVGDQGVADDRRADPQPGDGGGRLDRDLEGPGLVAVVRRLPRAGPSGLRDRPAVRTPRRPVGEIPPPASADEPWREEEYVETTRALVAAYRSAGGPGPMPLEKDFSPTLAGSDRACQRDIVLDWLTRVPA